MNDRVVRARLREYGVDMSDQELLGGEHYEALLLGASEWAVSEGEIVKAAFTTPRGHRELIAALLHAERCYMLQIVEGGINGGATPDREQTLKILYRVGHAAAREAYAKFRNPGLLGKIFG